MLQADMGAIVPNSADGMQADAVAGEDGLRALAGESAGIPADQPVTAQLAFSGPVAAGSAEDTEVGSGQEARPEADEDVAEGLNPDGEPMPEPVHAGRRGAGRSVAEILEGVDLSNEAERARVVAEMAAAEEIRYAAVLEKAKELGIPVRKEGPGNRMAILHDFRGDEPLYRVTMNKNAAISSAANLLYPTPYSLEGTGVKVGVWDAGAVHNTHQEFSATRVVKRDPVATDDHATLWREPLAPAG